MTGHRQEMFTIELTVGEIQDACERRILEKYKFLTKEDGWECEDMGFHTDNLRGTSVTVKGLSGFYVKEIPLVEDAPIVEKKTQCECENFLKPCR
jgi:hypothetical protein